MHKIAFVAMLPLAAIIVGASGSTAVAQEQEVNSKPKKVVVAIKQGDSLTKIGKKYGTTYVRIYNANKKIEHPDVIHPGQEIRIPNKTEKLPNRPIPGVTKSQPVATAPAVPPKRAISAPAGSSNFANGSTVWDSLAACEAGGNWAINTGNGYFGGLQFTLSSWRGVGGSGYPHQASREEQISRGKMLQARQGWGAWPACSAKLGLR